MHVTTSMYVIQLLSNDKMTLDIAANYILQNDRNVVNQGEYNNPLVGAYLYPRGNEWADAELYEVYDPARKSMFKLDSG